MLSGLVQDAENPAVLEKQHLTSTSRHSSNHSLGGPSGSGSGPLPRSLRALAPHFTSLNVRIPRTGKVLLIPIPSALVSTSNYAHNSPRSANFTSPHTPRRGPATGIGSQGHGSYNPLQPPRKRPSLLGYLVLFLVTLFCILRLRHHRPNITIPFVPSSTNILDDEQIARLWQWEIGRGHYPSSRRTPSSLNLGGLNNPGVDASSWDFHPLPGDAKTAGLPKGPSRFPAEFPGIDAVRPVGPKRHYLNISEPQRHALAAPPSPYPPRPEPNSILDLDIVMDHCDFTANRYVRDCLEVLRTGAGLDKQHRLRRGKMDHWKHLYTEERKLVSAREAGGSDSVITEDGKDVLAGLGYVQKDPHALNPGAAREHQRTFIAHSTGTGVSHAQVEKNLRPPNLPLRQNIVGHGSEARPHPTHPTADPMCDPDYPKIFHIFWAGPFTDKPYLAVQSFLYTQNLGLHLDPNSAQMREFLQTTCRPQLWVWINPGPAASLPNPHARSQMFESLRDNPWSAPFLHDRFSQAVKFRMWNTTEQLDGIPELRDHWRSLPLFNSGGVKYGTPSQQQPADDEEEEAATAEQDSATEGEGVVPQAEEEQRGRFGTEADHVDAALAVKGGAMNATAAPESVTKRNPRITSPSRPKKKKDDELINRIGSTSSSGYDRLTVVLSDMARFVLTHRFGGVYLDADTIFLRDWEELWGWKGAFAYRWSRLEKYNTAVLKMQRNSAIGSFLFKSALANGLDFHPMTISRYTKDANVEGLLLRLPDALFDSAWLNTEYYQRDRPPYPYFKRFEDVSGLDRTAACDG